MSDQAIGQYYLRVEGALHVQYHLRVEGALHVNPLQAIEKHTEKTDVGIIASQNRQSVTQTTHLQGLRGMVLTAKP